MPCRRNTSHVLSKLADTCAQLKNSVTSKSPIEDISVVTLIRTDTTLDYGQKAEKVWRRLAARHVNHMLPSDILSKTSVTMLQTPMQVLLTCVLTKWTCDFPDGIPPGHLNCREAPQPYRLTYLLRTHITNIEPLSEPIQRSSFRRTQMCMGPFETWTSVDIIADLVGC